MALLQSAAPARNRNRPALNPTPHAGDAGVRRVAELLAQHESFSPEERNKFAGVNTLCSPPPASPLARDARLNHPLRSCRSLTRPMPRPLRSKIARWEDLAVRIAEILAAMSNPKNHL